MTNSQVHMEYLTVFENHQKCLILIFEFWRFKIDLSVNTVFWHLRSSLRLQC